MAFRKSWLTDLLSREVGTWGGSWRQVFILQSRVLIADGQSGCWGGGTEEIQGQQFIILLGFSFKLKRAADISATRPTGAQEMVVLVIGKAFPRPVVP